ASLDKLLGIYFLARICLNLFQLTEAMTLVLLIIGGVTIISAVMMALVQHSYKRLLGYHAVSQVGYMVTGIALGSPLGLIAGLFHMLNNAIYKSGLFLTAGSVEKRTGKEDLDELGGLSKLMPLTFISALIFALSISGIPPFNGFASKWMIYQGLIEFGKGSGIAHQLWFVWLTLAVLGSALTLASFVKFISGIFLGSSNKKLVNVREVSILMWLPQIILALLCIGFGVFAVRLVIPALFAPITGEFSYPGIWNSQAVSILILVSIVLGVIIYLIGNIRNFRSEESFLGGEIIHDKSNYNPLEFYKTIGEFPLLAFFYRKAEHKWFDIYDLGRRFVLWLNGIFSFAHSGILSTYITWLIMGMVILLIILI
ncbi:MAG: hypothetical protein JW784_00870, partial [Candidatus Cloacimonetes bacterium]|nr:hypothetical protein [Candidatus Cloacimonadota bacterium]